MGPLIKLRIELSETLTALKNPETSALLRSWAGARRWATTWTDRVLGDTIVELYGSNRAHCC